jgi:ABC-type spermidine/putrescine transport system permease subunit II
VAAWALTFVLGLGYYATPVMLGGVREQTTLQALILNDIAMGGSWNHAAALGVLLVVVALLGFMLLAWAGGLRVIYGGRSDLARRKGGRIASAYQRFAYSDRLWSRPGAFLESLAATRALRSAHMGLVLLILLYLAAPTMAAIPASLSGGTLVELTPDTWSIRWYVTLFQDEAWSSSLRTSLLVSIPAAVLATLIGLCAAIALVRRYHGVGTRYLTTMLMPMIMPIQVTALGLFFVLTYVGIAFTPLALFLGYTLLGLPYAVVVLSAALQGFDWDVDRAAQSLGSPWWRRAVGILLPLLRPALMVSLLFAFITAFSELIFALFMRTVYLTTLPVELWSAVRYDLDPTTAAAAGVTLIASVLAVWLVALGRLRRWSR